MYRLPDRQLVRAAQMPLEHLGGIARHEDALTVAILRSSISGVRHRVKLERFSSGRSAWRITHAIPRLTC